jgi:hypothetical protein|nr:MAG TPA: hypothetical protein [Caudoviricetes sp.]
MYPQSKRLFVTDVRTCIISVPREKKNITDMFAKCRSKSLSTFLPNIAQILKKGIIMANTLWHPANEKPQERTHPLLLATKTTWRDKDGKMLQGVSPTAYFLGCYADGQFWDEIGERLPEGVTVTHWMAFPMV